jgi:hypothetical protein
VDENGNLNACFSISSEDRNLDFGQGFRSNKFELRVWNISK